MVDISFGIRVDEIENNILFNKKEIVVGIFGKGKSANRLEGWRRCWLDWNISVVGQGMKQDGSRRK